MDASLKNPEDLFVDTTSAIAVELSEKSFTEPVGPELEEEVNVRFGLAFSSNLSMFKSVIRIKDIWTPFRSPVLL